MGDNGVNGQRFKRIVPPSPSQSLDLDPLLSGNLDNWPHLKELLQSYKADWVKDDSKYGQYEAVSPPVFEPQVFEGPDTDVETELSLAIRGRESDEEEPSTSGRYSSRSDSDPISPKKHYGGPPLPCYCPVFNWQSERSSFFGQRTPELPLALSHSGLKISVKLVALTMQAGLVEPIYGTMCLYNKEKREKLSEDFHFRFLPSEFQDESGGGQKNVVFSLESGSPVICLLIQLEKHVTEEGGVTPSVYTRKEPICLSEKEKQKLQTWARVMPFREPFAWATVALFDSSVTGGVGGFTSPSSPLPPSLLGSGLMEAALDMDGRLVTGGDSKHHDTRHDTVLVDVPGLNRVKENYMEETLLDPKRLAHKPVKANLRLEVERLAGDEIEPDTLSECGSFSNSSIDGEGRELSLGRHSRHASSSNFSKGAFNGRPKWSSMDKHRLAHSASASSFEFGRPQFKAIEFRTSNRGEPMSKMLHCLYAYPQTVNLNKKRNLFVRVELRKDDFDIRKPPLEALYPRDTDSNMQKYGHSQIDISSKTPHFHDEFKIRLPAVITQQHHLLFTFFHVDLQMKLEAPKPVVVGYSVLPLMIAAQVMRLEGTLPVVRELLPHYLEEGVKEQMELLDEGKAVFRLRTRMCSSLYPVNEKIREFFAEYDKYVLRTGPPMGSDLLEAINGLKHVESAAMLQFLQPTLNMLLRMIGDGGETLQVAAFRAMVNIITRVQQEAPDGVERNKYLVQYVDYSFDDFGGVAEPVYPGLCSVWRSLARSKAKGYRVGPVYDDVLSMSWFFLELIYKSMALQQSRENIPSGEDLPPLQLQDEVFKSIGQLFDCLLTEVHDRCKKNSPLAKRLNSSIAFFCYDLLSVIEPRQVFQLVALYFDKFTGVCQTMLHECKLNFLQIISDHDLFVEMPGRDPSERNYLVSILMQELFVTFDHEDSPLKIKAARTLAVLICKHEYDARYQTFDDKLYIAQRYFPLITLILEEMPVFYNLNPPEKREILVCMLHFLHHLDDASLIKAWQQSAAQTRLFFKLLEECQNLFEYKKAGADGLMGAMPLAEQGDGTIRYTEKLSPSVNLFLGEASRHDGRWSTPQATADSGSSFWKRVSPQLSSPTQAYSMRDAMSSSQSQGSGKSSAQLRASLHPMLRHKLELWEENLSAAVTLQILEIVEKFMDAAAVHVVVTDYVKLDCITTIFTGFLSRSQPLPFWKYFLPVFNNLFRSHGATLMSRENDRFLKQVVFHLLRLAVFRNESIRKRAVVGLQILVRTSFCFFKNISRLRVMLTITLSELMSDVQVTQTRMDGRLEKSGEAQRLQTSLQQMALSETSKELLRDCGLPESTLEAKPDDGPEDLWSWTEMVDLSATLLKALDAATEHALMAPSMMTDKYSTTEGFHGLAWAYKNVPDLHIMWLLYLCDAHQQNQSWAEAAQCAIAVAGVIMQAIVGQKDNLWGKEHIDALCKICPMLRSSVVGEAAVAGVEGYGTSKLTIESAVKYLQLADKLFFQAELFHFCADIQELIIPVHKIRRNYGQLSKCYTTLCSVYMSIQEQEASPIPFKDATYYRVGFYGSQFGKMDRKEYVYREARDVRLGDIMQAMGNIYEAKVVEGGQTLHIIPDSRQVNDQDLKPGVCYLQITSVDPVLEDEDLDIRKERKPVEIGAKVTSRVFDRFLFDTPFTKNGRTQGGLEAQWKRRTVLQSEGPFPALVNRLLVIKSESREFSPIENAIGMIEARTLALVGELEEHERTDGDQAPRLQSLQRILQGSVAVQVNSGVLGVCTAFLSGEPATKLKSQELQQLIAALMEFMAVCKKAIRVHSRLIAEDEQDFHSNLVIGFQSLSAELSHYIPAILTEL